MRRSPTGFEVFERRSTVSWCARTYVMMDYDMPADRVEEAVALTPGLEGPTSRRCIARAGSPSAPWCRGPAAQQLMDDLYEIGARAILLTDIHACRL